MPYRNFSARSRRLLDTVEPALGNVVRTALTLSTVDFGVTDAIRTILAQEKLVASGASQTMNSRHLPNARGLSEAVDLAAYLDTDNDGTMEYSWHSAHALQVAEAMRKAAIQHGVRIRWGGCWREINTITTSLDRALTDYVTQRAASGRKPFIDMPHFELITP